MNLAKGVPSSTQGGAGGNGNSQEKSWKTTNVGPTITRNGKVLNWCPWHNKYVLHKPSVCLKNPDHPDHGKKKENSDTTKKLLAENQDNRPSLQMNLLDMNEYTPINPWITLASTNGVTQDHISDTRQAILDHGSVQVNDETLTSSQDTSNVTKKAQVTYKVGPHTSFWGYSS